MIVALCDMTEVSSDDKYDVSVTLTTAIMARPSAMSVDSCHNERVTPLLAVSRRDENNKKSPASLSRSRMSRVSRLPEAPCQTKLDLVEPGQDPGAQHPPRLGGEARVITHQMAPPAGASHLSLEL